MRARHGARIVLGLAMSILGACESAAKPSPSATTLHPVPVARVSHVVLIKLNDSSQAAALIIDCDRMLGPIPGVVAMHAGRHLDTGRGAKVTSDYDVGLWIAFDSEASLRAYDVDPNHTALLAKWKPQVQSIRVYDILDE